MLGRIFTVGGYTLLSRLTGRARDIMLAAVLGAGPVAGAVYVALWVANSFRVICSERLFSTRIFPLLYGWQVILLVVAWLFMPQAMSILAPSFTEDSEQRRMA